MLEETENRDHLQRLLADERARCNQYKQIYQTLKDNHAKLQEELTSIYQQLKEATAQNEETKLSNKSYIQRLENTVKDKQTEIQSLKDKINSFDPKQIREVVLEEASQHYEAKIRELQAEADRSREQYNYLHLDCAVLKCSLESKQSEHLRIIEGLKLQHHGEVEQLKTKLENLEKDEVVSPDGRAIELKNAQREILQLSSKLKTLLSETEELRAQNENLTLKMNSLSRSHSKQLTEHVNNLREIDAEKLKLLMQKEVLEKELTSSQEQRKSLHNELQACKQESFQLKSKAEECEHKCCMVTTNLQVETERWKSEKEAEQEQLHEEILKLKQELHDLNEELTHSKQNHLQKERDFQVNLCKVKQKVSKQTSDLEEEKSKITEQLKSMEIEQNLVISKLRKELQSVNDKLEFVSTEKSQVEKELGRMRNTLEGTKGMQTNEEGMHQNLDKEIGNLKDKIELLIARKSFTEPHVKPLQRLRRIPEEGQGDDFEMMQLKLSWEQHKFQLRQRLEDVESQLKETKMAAVSQKQEMGNKLKLYARLIDKLRKKLDVLNAHTEELEAERDILKKNVPHEVHSEVKKQVSELNRQLEYYQQALSIELRSSEIPGKAPLMEKFISNKPSVEQHITAPSEPVGESEVKSSPQKTDKDTRRSYPRKKSLRRSLKTRNRDLQASKVVSPVISSSSELEHL